MNDLKHYYELELKVGGGPEFDQLTDKEQLRIADSLGFAAFKLHRAKVAFKVAIQSMIDDLPTIGKTKI